MCRMPTREDLPPRRRGKEVPFHKLVPNPRSGKSYEDLERAREWLKSPQFALGGEIPLEYADTEPGAQIVEDLLGRIEHGTPV
jgi:Protein of unknown function (DUF2384)